MILVAMLMSSQAMPLESGPQWTSFCLTRPLPPQMSQDALLVLLRISARPSVLLAAVQDDVVDLDALVDEGGCGVTRDLSIGVFNDCTQEADGLKYAYFCDCRAKT